MFSQEYVAADYKTSNHGMNKDDVDNDALFHRYQNLDYKRSSKE